MSRLEWLRRTFVESGASLRNVRKSLSPGGMRRRKSASPCVVEGLEDRLLLTAFIVDTTSDDADDAAGVVDGLVSLREAIIAANTNAAFGDAPAGMINGDAIRFDPAVFTGAEAARTINIQNGVFNITDDLRITGVADDVILDAAGGDRIFRIVSSQLTVMQDLTLRNAVSNDGAGGAAMRISGGGRTILSRVTIENATAAGRGAGILSVGSTLETFDVQILNSTAGFGGGIANVSGNATLNHTLIDGNTATQSGGGISNDGGRVILRDSVVSNNTANAAAGLRGGGGIHNINSGRLSISDSDIFGNDAINARGGGIFSDSGLVTIGDSSIGDNNAALSGGGIQLVNGQMSLVGSLLGGLGDETGNDAGRDGLPPGDGGGLHIAGGADVLIEDTRIQFNEATGDGGGIWNSQSGSLLVRGSTPPSITNITNVVSDPFLGQFIDPMIQILPDVDAYRALLGADNGGVPGSQGTGRREINWDGAPDAVSAPNLLPGDFFNDPMAPLSRGIELSTPGTGFQLSSTTVSNVPVLFRNVNANYGETFETFSPERLFTPLGSNVTEVTFFIPGTNTPGLVQGFGAVFTDVDLTGETFVEYFDKNGELLLRQDVAAVLGQETLSFTGVTFDFPAISRVRITTGDGPLGPKDISQNGPTDVVVMDDFIYGEPVPFDSFLSTTIIRNNEAHGDAANEGGGGLFNDGGRVTIADITISGNLADGAAGSGGGILSESGSVFIDEVTFSGNDARRAGGGVEVVDGTVTINDSIFDGNGAGLLPFGPPAPGNGGAVHTSDQAFVRINGGTVQNNVAVREGGGLWNAAPSVMIVDGTQISDNSALGTAADDGGGGIFNSGGRLVVNNALISGNTAEGTSGSGGGLFALGGATTVTDTVISQNTANRAGGGIEVAAGRIVMTNVDLIGNSAGDNISGNPGNGGGLHSTGASRVDITGGLIEGNLAAAEGGGLWNSSTGLMILHGGTAIRNNVAVGSGDLQGGGGIFNDGGRLAIAGAEISGNTAFGTGTSGGGLLNTGGLVTIENSTISGNMADGAGGGIANFSPITMLLTNVTVVLNESNLDGTQTDGGGIFTAAGAFTGLRNSIVAGNLAETQTRTRPRDNDLAGDGSFAGSTFNLIGDADSAATLIDGVNNNMVGIMGMDTIDLSTVLDLNLGDNGGPTQTHALTFSSPALNAGNNNLAINAAGAPLTTDQRGDGFTRIFNGTVDLGAFERSPQGL